MVVDKTSKYALLHACLRTIIWKFLSMVLPRLCYSALSLSQPFIIKGVLNFISAGSSSTETANGLIGATILVYAGISVSSTYT